MSSSEATPPTSSSPTEPATPPPSPPTSPPADSTPPPSPPADATSPPPPDQPPPSPTPSPPHSPPPAPPTSSPPPPVSTPSTPPPSPPATSESPPPPVASASPPPPAAVPSPPTPTATPSTPPPATDAAPVQNPPPQTADPPPTPANSPPQQRESSGETPAPPQSLTPSRPRSPSVSRPAGGTPLPPSPSDHNSTLPGAVIAGIVGGVLVIIGLLIVIICLVCKRRKKKPNYYMDPNGANQYYNQDPTQWRGQHPMDPSMKLHPPAGSFMGAPVSGWGAQPYPNSSGEFSTGHSSGQYPSQNMGGMTQFSYEDLAAATNGFSQANLLGQGGFGLVHKGVLPDGREVAVKSLKSGSGQGEREFQAEVEIISRVHHRHLVSLVGYCIAYEKKLLVYEFVANKTLEFHLYGKDQPVMEWPTRLRIAVGSAKGLAYLHEDCLPRIIHRDIKAANILLDSNYEAMVADFGLAKLTTDNNTHVSTRVMGTFGYLAPEYASSGKLSEKSDVFSFGVMLLELVTGRRPIDMTNMMEDSLVDWARPLLSKALEDGNFDELADPRLEGRYVHQELSRMAACAAASIRHSARKRPKMSQIVRALEGDSSLDDLNEGVKPGQSAVYNPNGGSGMYDTRAYNADMMKFKQMVMASGEFNSSEYGNTSEYGLNPSVSSSGSDYSKETEKTSRN